MRCRVLLEGAAFETATVHPEAVRVELAVQEGSTLEGLAAGAGGAGARLETSFAANTPDKVSFCILLPSNAKFKDTGLDRFRFAEHRAVLTCVGRHDWPIISQQGVQRQMRCNPQCRSAL